MEIKGTFEFNFAFDTEDGSSNKYGFKITAADRSEAKEQLTKHLRQMLDEIAESNRQENVRAA